MVEYYSNPSKWPNNQETHIDNTKNASKKIWHAITTLEYDDK